MADVLQAGSPEPAARHAGAPRGARIGVGAAVLAVAALLVGASATLTSLTAPAPAPATTEGSTAEVVESAALSVAEVPTFAGPIAALPVPEQTALAAAVDPCALPEVVAALGAGDDEAVIAGFGGAEPFRVAVTEDRAPCVSLDDPARTWMVVNKVRPYAPMSFRPTALAMPDGVRSLSGGALHEKSATALATMAADARDAGVGEIALASGFRSYETQTDTYRSHVAGRGVEGADLVSARPGFSEHQSGFAADVVACDGGCGTLDDLAATPQGRWVHDNAWRYGWVVRYGEGMTDVTGYVPEAWHLRYIGPALAQEYHDGGWESLEEFFGLQPAPDYIG